MRIIAVSDIHIDYDENRRWLLELSAADYHSDLLILAGDVADDARLLAFGLRVLSARFRKVFFVSGNHDLWTTTDPGCETSINKFAQVCAIAADEGVCMTAFHGDALSIVPLQGWYDFTFGELGEELRSRWSDFRACRWPDNMTGPAIAQYFLQKNEPVARQMSGLVISFSHFLPRIDVMPPAVPVEYQMLYPVLGSTRLGEQAQRLRSTIHIYGHSHVNRDVVLDGTRYVNNALGYPEEGSWAGRQLRCLCSV